MRQSKLSKQTEGAITLIIIISLLTSISTARGLGEDFMNLEWNLMEKAGDIEPLGSAGADLGATLTTDYIGTARPQNSVFDIGAYEYLVASRAMGLSGVVKPSGSVRFQ